MNDLNDLIAYGKTLKVLYIEDNTEARKQTIKLLKNFFNDIDIATNGMEGLSKYVEYHDRYQKYYDIVVSDINMPKIDGIEMCLQMLELNKKQAILIISAYAESEKLQQLIDIGITNFVNKPIDGKVFLKKITKIINLLIERKNEEQHFKEIEKLNQELDAMMDSFDTYVIASRTDLKGIITYASKAYENISGYTKEELIGKPHNIVRHPDMPKSAFKDMWATIKSGKLWVGEVKNLKKDGDFYWVKAYVAPYYNKDNKHIGYSAIRLDITDKKKVEELHAKVNTLLNNTGEGFLSFDKNLKCEDSFSKECLKIFEVTDISGMDISKLLFEKDKKNKELFCEGINNIANSKDDLSKDLFLSLMPKEAKIQSKIIQINYKILDNDRFMLILQDITKNKKLEKKLEKQNKIHQMIVSVISDKNEFIELKIEFEDFIAHPPEDKKVLLQRLHTYKGIFAQKNFIHTPDALHELESMIENNDWPILETFDKFGLQEIFKKDIKIINKNIGEDFLNETPHIKIDIKQFNDILSKLHTLNISYHQDPQCEKIITRLEKLSYINLFDALKEYPSRVHALAEKLGKSIYPLEIKGDKNTLLPPKFKDFLKTLVHVFGNCVEHGIEEMDIRAELKKDEIATIKCSYYTDDDKLFLDIADDGSGINTDKVVQNAIKKGLIDKNESSKMSEKEKLKLIFLDQLSTKKKVSITAGRGVGMSAVQNEVNKLGGQILIDNKTNEGINFRFILPL